MQTEATPLISKFKLVDAPSHQSTFVLSSLTFYSLSLSLFSLLVIASSPVHKSTG
jgi:hypothetical protein